LIREDPISPPPLVSASPGQPAPGCVLKPACAPFQDERGTIVISQAFAPGMVHMAFDAQP
jgi:hypothetical protein